MVLLALMLVQVATVSNPLSEALDHFNRPELGCTAQVAMSHSEVAVDCQDKKQFRSLRQQQPNKDRYDAFGAGTSGQNGALRFYVKPKST